MKIFRHTHTSSRYDRSAQSLEAALDNYMKDADLITLTEVASPTRSDKIKEKGWGGIWANHGGGDDSAIAWRQSEFELVYADSTPLTNGRLAGSRTNIYAARAVLEHVSGARLVVSSVHLPASVEGRGGFKKAQRYAVWKVCQVALRLKTNALARRFNADAVMIVADWNINIKMSWVQAWFKTNFPTYRLTWQKPFPSRGTHGRRIIDLTLIGGALKTVKKPWLLKKDSSSDHVAYSEVLGF